ncbi:MAG: ribonuclease J [Ardenticatenaceae bacterium]|nr:ribonuclease J [Anaerolineales bacterium]MCB8985185.1 ribonuclease J [Ardenticatenaceae bacterium]
MTKNLKIIPLGGLGEIGKNMTLLEYGRNQIIVDCGVMFPESDMYGIDLVLPQFDYVVENQDILRGIVLTHGHMDHIGGLPYLLERVNAPIYGTALTIGMVERQLEEAHVLERASLEVIDDKQTLHLGPFRISPFAVAHSIPAAVGLVIDTPVGAVIHTGDYKLDETPTGGRTTDFKRLRELTPNGVLALMGDSTNADRPGRTPTEQLVADTLDQLFAEAAGSRIIIATFSSLLARLQEIMRLADKYGRKVALTGRSLQQNVELARDLGYLKIPKKLLVDISDNIPDDKLVILSTGSQGEPRSALNRMAKGEHRQIQVHDGDTIIVSGGTIPGNEEDVGRMLNNLFARGANVIYGSLATVHVSGHGSREDMRIMLETVKPRFLIPVHGETRHLHLHARLAQECGLAAEDVFILHNGATWVTDGDKAWQEGSIPAEDVYVDGSLVGEIGELVMRDRERLAQDGFVVVYVPIDRQHKLAGEPSIISRGFLRMDTSGDLMDAARKELKRQLKRNGRNHDDTVRETLQNFFYHKTQSRPVILSNIVRV